jgi:hypothetical protein
MADQLVSAPKASSLSKTCSFLGTCFATLGLILSVITALSTEGNVIIPQLGAVCPDVSAIWIKSTMLKPEIAGYGSALAYLMLLSATALDKRKLQFSLIVLLSVATYGFLFLLLSQKVTCVYVQYHVAILFCCAVLYMAPALKATS